MFSNINYCEQFHCFALQFSTTRPDEHYGNKFSFSMYIHTTKRTILTSFEYIRTHIADIIVRILGPVDLLASINTPLFNLIKEKRIRGCLHGGRKILEGGSSQCHIFSVFSLHAKGCTCPWCSGAPNGSVPHNICSTAKILLAGN